jgi:predicted DNA-binding transcriptional regulator AlpA
MIPTAENPSLCLTRHRRRHLDTASYGLGPDDRLIKLGEVKALTGYASTSIYTKIKLGSFPAPVKLDKIGGSRWVLGEIRKFNADAIAARDRARQSAGRPRGEFAAALPA